MIEYLFLDLDDTILDFHKAEAVALDKTLRELGVAPNEHITQRYKQINIHHWKMLERGEITREQVKLRRFSVLFAELGLTIDPRQTTERYEKHLAVGHYFLPGAEAAVKALARKYRLFLASNGTAAVQAGRLTSADLYRYFEQVFVSEEIGHNKPSKAYFDICFSRIDGFDPRKAMMVGDSLTSDIRGGKNAGILTCWINPGHKPADPEIRADYEIESLAQLETLLSGI
ncbi:MAG: YjjG family noncanonical pyrimidine nucleotidase [Oscillospiraceae bacterium]|nr:YjjG family noncanonical pyrimidine nucleotidase [Oscillospiraceae bacterium]